MLCRAEAYHVFLKTILLPVVTDYVSAQPAACMRKIFLVSKKSFLPNPCTREVLILLLQHLVYQ